MVYKVTVIKVEKDRARVCIRFTETGNGLITYLPVNAFKGTYLIEGDTLEVELDDAFSAS